jgi:hypothetical protein
MECSEDGVPRLSSQSISDQLRPLQQEIRAGKHEVKPVVQVTSELAGLEPSESVVVARHCLLRWLRDKQRITDLPDAAWNGSSFELDSLPSHSVAVESFGDLWALRFDKADDQVHGRIWRSEAIVGLSSGVALVGARLTVISREWDIPHFKSVPRAILDLVQSPGLVDYGVSLRSAPIDINTNDDLESLIALLENRARTRPVYVVSTALNTTLDLDATRLALRTAGLAHVVRLSKDVAWAFSDIVGRNLSVYGDAIRTYKPGFDRYSGAWEDHPLATGDWIRRRFVSADRFMAMLVENAISDTVLLPNLERRLPSFTSVRQVVSQRRLEAARKDTGNLSEMMEIYRQDNDRLREDIAAAEQLLDEKERIHQGVQAERERFAQQNYNLRTRIALLESHGEQRERDQDVQWPTRYEEMESWAAMYLGDRLLLLPRALRGLKKAEYNEVQTVAKALRYLGSEYWELRAGSGTREASIDAARNLGVEVAPTGDQATLRQWREQYEVSWGSERCFLDTHLKCGSSRDPRNCLRIYFFWDEDSNQIVVGHLPNHLTNEAS